MAEEAEKAEDRVAHAQGHPCTRRLGGDGWWGVFFLNTEATTTTVQCATRLACCCYYCARLPYVVAGINFVSLIVILPSLPYNDNIKVCECPTAGL